MGLRCSSESYSKPSRLCEWATMAAERNNAKAWTAAMSRRCASATAEPVRSSDLRTVEMNRERRAACLGAVIEHRKLATVTCCLADKIHHKANFSRKCSITCTSVRTSICMVDSQKHRPSFGSYSPERLKQKRCFFVYARLKPGFSFSSDPLCISSPQVAALTH